MNAEYFTLSSKSGSILLEVLFCCVSVDDGCRLTVVVAFIIEVVVVVVVIVVEWI